MRTQIVAILLAALTIAGLAALADTAMLKRSEPRPDTADYALRRLLDLRTIETTHQLPSGYDHYVVELLHFEDGKRLSCSGLRLHGSIERGSRSIRIEVLWGEVNGNGRLVFRAADSGHVATNEFWGRLNSGLAVSFGKSQPFEVYEGYPIIAYATSRIRRDGKDIQVGGLDFSESLATYKYVGALSVRTFKTAEEAEKEAYR